MRRELGDVILGRDDRMGLSEVGTVEPVHQEKVMERRKEGGLLVLSSKSAEKRSWQKWGNQTIP